MENSFEIFERTHYSRATSKLIRAVNDVAKEVMLKMQTLDVESLSVNNLYLKIREVKANCGYSYEYLSCSSGSLQDNKSFYYCNDFNCYINRADSSDFVRFAKEIINVLTKLSSIEDKLTEDAKCSDFFEFYESWRSYEETKKQQKDFDNNHKTL